MKILSYSNLIIFKRWGRELAGTHSWKRTLLVLTDPQNSGMYASCIWSKRFFVFYRNGHSGASSPFVGQITDYGLAHIPCYSSSCIYHNFVYLGNGYYISYKHLNLPFFLLFHIALLCGVSLTNQTA